MAGPVPNRLFSTKKNTGGYRARRRWPTAQREGRNDSELAKGAIKSTRRHRTQNKPRPHHRRPQRRLRSQPPKAHGHIIIGIDIAVVSVDDSAGLLLCVVHQRLLVARGCFARRLFRAVWQRSNLRRRAVIILIATVGGKRAVASCHFHHRSPRLRRRRPGSLPTRRARRAAAGTRRRRWRRRRPRRRPRCHSQRGRSNRRSIRLSTSAQWMDGLHGSVQPVPMTWRSSGEVGR